MRLTSVLGGRIALVVLACSTTMLLSAVSSNAIPFFNPFGNAQEVGVRAALSEFGKSIGDQLPIVVSPSDAFPTTDLPGAAFSAQAATDITQALRNSADGTVVLRPGDYQFTVDVFCMQVHAGSPTGHRYLVAPLRGSAADIFRALNSRAPSYSLDHHALQVLSWDIQAGLPYRAMQAAQRAIVDRVIPDYRQRLQGDVYDNIRSQYQQIVGRVPGMPSFEEALSRIGAPGLAVLQIQALREQMAQPPPTFQELARELVPLVPLERGGSGPTPWSRYSDRVYMRFLTSGNYATPGVYQVRVMPGLDPPDPGAPVPFTNIVNNPGTPAVQPLTQAPQPGGLAQNPEPTPSPTATPTIESETFAKSPTNRKRTTVGVGEPVKLTFSGKDAAWSISSTGGKLDSTSGQTVFYTASIKPTTETIVAADTTTGATAKIEFRVFGPHLYFETVTPGIQIHHHKGFPDVGFSAKIYLEPKDVSFEYINVREADAQYKATGWYAWMNGMSHLCTDETLLPHCPLGPAVNPLKLVKTKGWLLPGPPDDVYSGGNGPLVPPFAPGIERVDIPWEYDAAADGDTGPFYTFETVIQLCQFKPDGSLFAQKGNAEINMFVSSPNYQ